MLKSATALLAAGAILGLGATAASAQQAAPRQYSGTLDEYVSCSALLFVQADRLSNPEEKGAFEAAVGVTLGRAETLGAPRGLNVDALIERAVEQTIQIEEAIDAASTPEAKDNTLWTWGPGMVRCIDLALEE